ncbi:MAG: YheU family protein [Bdellovibrionales bacterium]|nr:YheU family protein [Bdellovibrionales bacterium]
MDIEKESQPPVEVPLDALNEDTIRAIIESFILREGTDYGREEVGFETKVTQVEKQLAKGDVKIVFDPNTETVGIVTAHEWAKLQRRHQ